MVSLRKPAITCQSSYRNLSTSRAHSKHLELGEPEEAANDRYKRIVARPEAFDELLVELFVQSHSRAPRELWLNLDATDDPLHGHQEGRFFHGYYRCYCYLPLYIFCGEHLLCARLHESNQDASAGSIEELERIVGQIRRHWPRTRIHIRGDSGFCRESIMQWCEDHGVGFVLGLARNQRLTRALGAAMHEAHSVHRRTGKPARRFRDFTYRTRKSWSRSRRMVGKAEYLSKGENPRFVMTNLSPRKAAARRLYDKLYCARGEIEDRIKEQQLDLFADRTSAHTMRANQLRLYFSSFAYVLMHALRRLGTEGTQFARAQCSTLRLKLLKIGARIKITARRVWLSFSQAYPYAKTFTQCWRTCTKSPCGIRPDSLQRHGITQEPVTAAPPRSPRVRVALSMTARPTKVRDITLKLCRTPTDCANRHCSLHYIDKISVIHKKCRSIWESGDGCGLATLQLSPPNERARQVETGRARRGGPREPQDTRSPLSPGEGLLVRPQPNVLEL